MKHIKKFTSSRLGDVAEYYAVTWLWDQGYEVFQNSGCSGPIDMLALKDNKIILIDVKTFQNPCKETRLSYSSGVRRTKKQIKMGVKILGFNPITRDLKFVEHKE